MIDLKKHSEKLESLDQINEQHLIVSRKLCESKANNDASPKLLEQMDLALQKLYTLKSKNKLKFNNFLQKIERKVIAQYKATIKSEYRQFKREEKLIRAYNSNLAFAERLPLKLKLLERKVESEKLFLSYLWQSIKLALKLYFKSNTVHTEEVKSNMKNILNFSIEKISTFSENKETKQENIAEKQDNQHIHTRAQDHVA